MSLEVKVVKRIRVKSRVNVQVSSVHSSSLPSSLSALLSVGYYHVL